jgi:hypothetical protein
MNPALPAKMKIAGLNQPDGMMRTGHTAGAKQTCQAEPGWFTLAETKQKQRYYRHMKKVLLAVAMMCGLTALGADKTGKNALLASDKMIWTGLDFTMTRMVGPGEFTKPDSIFPGMLEAWNDLFLQERISFVEKATKKQLVIDIGGVTKANKGADAKQIIHPPGAEDTIEKSHITPEMIAKAVKSYKMENKSGLGVVFIVDRLIKMDKKGTGAVYVVAFDVATREVVYSQREVCRAVGFGFRNFWFGVIKNAEKTLKKIK